MIESNVLVCAVKCAVNWWSIVMPGGNPSGLGCGICRRSKGVKIWKLPEAKDKDHNKWREDCLGEIMKTRKGDCNFKRQVVLKPSQNLPLGQCYGSWNEFNHFTSTCILRNVINKIVKMKCELTVSFLPFSPWQLLLISLRNALALVWFAAILYRWIIISRKREWAHIYIQTYNGMQDILASCDHDCPVQLLHLISSNVVGNDVTISSWFVRFTKNIQPLQITFWCTCKLPEMAFHFSVQVELNIHTNCTCWYEY